MNAYIHTYTHTLQTFQKRWKEKAAEDMGIDLEDDVVLMHVY